jgi:integrase
MPHLTNRVPRYCRHRASGQAYSFIDGRMIYLGVFGTAASKTEYSQLIAEWLTAGRRLPTDPQAVTVAEVVAAFRRHAAAYYGPNSRAAVNIDESLRPVVKLYATTPAAEFGPLRLKAARESMITAGRVRANINRHISNVRGVFKWAAENEMIPASVYHGLMAVKGLLAGRSGAVEGRGVKPVPVEYVEAVIPHVAPQIAAMIRLQLLTGMRPGEVCIMRGSDIDTTGKLWVYRPAHHKTQHHGYDRAVYLGPKAQEVLRPFLKSDLSAYLFSPADADACRRAKLHAERKTPLSCGNCAGSNLRKCPKRKPGEHYSSGSYLVAVYRGCDRAFPPPPDMTNEADTLTWRRERRWHPHQLRHTAATMLRKEHGLEAAQVILGHRTLTVTQVYAEKNVEVAQAVMELVG